MIIIMADLYPALQIALLGGMAPIVIVNVIVISVIVTLLKDVEKIAHVKRVTKKIIVKVRQN